MVDSKKKPKDSLEMQLLRRFRDFNIDDELRKIGENVRQQAILEVQNLRIEQGKKDKIINSIKVVDGLKAGEVLVTARSECGQNLEFGTQKNKETPWFIPALVMVTGSIDKCLHGALQRALLRARRFHIRR